MSIRHELFDELDAFCPGWTTAYKSLHQAVLACSIPTPYVSGIYQDWLSTPAGVAYVADVESVFDYQGAIAAMQQAEEESALPYKFGRFGSLPGGAHYDE